MAARARQWRVDGPVTSGRPVALRNYINDLAAGEDLNDNPPAVSLSWADWQAQHDSVYGMTLDGRQTADVTAVRQALQTLKAKAASADPDAALWVALLRILRRITDDA